MVGAIDSTSITSLTTAPTARPERAATITTTTMSTATPLPPLPHPGQCRPEHFTSAHLANGIKDVQQIHGARLKQPRNVGGRLPVASRSGVAMTSARAPSISCLCQSVTLTRAGGDG